MVRSREHTDAVHARPMCRGWLWPAGGPMGRGRRACTRNRRAGSARGAPESWLLLDPLHAFATSGRELRMWRALCGTAQRLITSWAQHRVVHPVIWSGARGARDGSGIGQCLPAHERGGGHLRRAASLLSRANAPRAFAGASRRRQDRWQCAPGEAMLCCRYANANLSKLTRCMTRGPAASFRGRARPRTPGTLHRSGCAPALGGFRARLER
jgi:hypothetical protein